MVLQRKDTVILVGSGASLWSGLPTWGRLISSLADYIEKLGRNAELARQELNNNDLLLAASYGVFQLSPSEFSTFIKDVCRTHVAKPSKIHELITRLGPTSFITTNYDTLLEDAFRDDSSISGLKRPQVVTNRASVEIGQIIQSSSRDFIFKYHGDVNDSESVILTREHYQTLKAKFKVVNEALSILLATRPVVMIGFGMRDPDFLSIKDDLKAAFGEQVGEHFAIMADFNDLEADYWRRTYNIEVVSYETSKNLDGAPDHSKILPLLQSLSSLKDKENFSRSKADWNILLSRLAGRYVAFQNSQQEQIFPLTVSVKKEGEAVWAGPADELFGRSDRNIIVGGPGSGKSFLLRRHASLLSQELLAACWGVELKECIVPIFVDLRQYQGDLLSLIQTQLPDTLTLSDLIAERTCRFLFDGANEMPEHLADSGIFKEDLARLLQIGPQSHVTITGREGGWLSDIDFSFATLNFIEREVIENTLRGRDNTKTVDFNLVDLLNTPLLLSLVISKKLSANVARTPSDVHRMVFSELQRKWNERSKKPIDFVSLLAPLAFRMLDRGVEHIASDEAAQHFKEKLDGNDELAKEIIEFLILESIFQVLPDYKMVFFHQTATEFLASIELGTLGRLDLNKVYERLSYRRWDQAIFAAIGMLSGEISLEFFKQLVEIDIVSAFRASRHISDHQSEVATILLEKLILSAGQRVGGFEISEQYLSASLISGLRIGLEHEQLLIRLANARNRMGAVAAGELMKLNPAHRTYFISELMAGIGSYSFLSDIGSLLSESVTRFEVDSLLARVSEKELGNSGKNTGIEKYISGLSKDELHTIVSRSNFISTAAQDLLTRALEKFSEQWVFDFLVSCVKQGSIKSIYPLYRFLKSWNWEEPLILQDSEELGNLLISLVFSGEADDWVLKSIGILAKNSEEFNRMILSKASNLSANTCGFMNALVNNEVDKRIDFVRNALTHLSSWNSHEIQLLCSSAMWENLPKDLIKDAFQTKNTVLIHASMNGMWKITALPSDIAEPHWWFELLTDYALNDVVDNFVFVSNLSNWLVSDEGFCKEALSLFNEGKDPFFKFLARYIIQKIPSANWEVISEVARERLLGCDFGLRNRFGASIIGSLATEAFVNDYLLPKFLEISTDTVEKIELAYALSKAGLKHNRRYLLSGSDVSLLSRANSARTIHRKNGDWSLTIGD